MKKITTILALAAGVQMMSAQSVTDAYQLSQNDLRGTARYMSMGGAFGALGGDLSVLTQNPGGIGVYRSNDIGATFEVDIQNGHSEDRGVGFNAGKTHLNLNTLGGVWTMKLNNSVMPNINLGFTYNRAATFNRRYKGTISGLRTSLSNYMAGVANSTGLTEADVTSTDSYDPYNPSYGNVSAPWLTILGYDSYMITPDRLGNGTRWYGQYGEGTSGSGYYDMIERGGVDEYSIALGGNIKNKVFWGIDLGITSIDYRVDSMWGESLDNAYVYNPVEGEQAVQRMTADTKTLNNYRVNGTGFNFKLGVIVKPIQELRIGLAFHTPTYYSLSQRFNYGEVDYSYGKFTTSPSGSGWDYAITNDGYPSYTNVNFRTPWKVIASLAGVIGSKFIISADYEWNGYHNMKYGTPSTDYYDEWYDDGWYDPWDYPWYSPAAERGTKAGTRSSSSVNYANRQIRNIYCDTHTIRVGGEYRVLNFLSLRLGYSFETSPVKQAVKHNEISVPYTGTITAYRLDNATNYVTAGIGFKHKGFYADLAYVYKCMTSNFYPFSPDPSNPAGSLEKSKIDFSDSKIALTVGFKF